MRPLGAFVQANAACLSVGLTVGLLLLCVVIKSSKLDAELGSWIRRTDRLESELAYVAQSVGGDGCGSTSQLVLQTPRSERADTSTNNNNNNNLLTVESLMIHLEALAIATHVTVDHYDVSWSIKDLCITPQLPEIELPAVSMVLEKMMPCVIATPLDCFWEGSKLLGPEHPVGFGSIGPKFKWTSLNPMLMVQALQRSHPNTLFPYNSLVDWMRRVGITSGYQEKPCLDPSDPMCPATAPNKFSGEAPNVGAQLTGGCRGLFANQWHWREEEIVSGLVRNKSSGQISEARALQSTVQLMGEQDMYDYWRKTNKVQDINNWSAEKAKLILDSWQKSFKDQLAQFTRTSNLSRPYKIHAMTSKSMLEPIDIYSLLDLTTFEICFALMTLFTCFTFPKFTKSAPAKAAQRSCQARHTSNDIKNLKSGHAPLDEQISQFKITLLAIVASSFVALTFIASLGLSSFMNLPFNMATTQVLPPLALCHGFNQLITVANIYSRRFALSNSLNRLATECLIEIFPIIKNQAIIHISTLLFSTLIPISATRVFALQAISYILLATLAAILLLPSLLTAFLLHHAPNGRQTLARDTVEIRQHHQARAAESGNVYRIDEHILSRIQDDLRNIQVDTSQPANINFSARFGCNGVSTSLQLTTSKQQQQHNGSFERQATQPIDTNTELYSATGDKFNHLPDLLQSALPKIPPTSQQPPTRESFISTEPKPSQVRDERSAITATKQEKDANECETIRNKCSAISLKLIENAYVQAVISVLALCSLVVILLQVSKIDYGLRLRDIVAHGTSEYDSFKIQEKHFPVYNVFAVTKGNFDYPTNQRLLHDFYKTIEEVDGIVKENETSRFWLVRFRSWLLEIQERFDQDRNKSTTGGDWWNQEASDAAKLAYKLLAQTGELDNPVDKSIVESNRLVDANGIINPKAFYYYLTAWVFNDPTSYASSEANFKPEPKSWNDNPDDLKIEKAKNLNYAQIPFLMKLRENHDSYKTISEIRSKSQAFELLNLPNFPTGIPFIFGDQIVHLDWLVLVIGAFAFMLTFFWIGLTSRGFGGAAIITIPIILTMIELYGLMGLVMVPVNNIYAVLLVGSIGMATVQTIHYSTNFRAKSTTRSWDMLWEESKTLITSFTLFFICILAFQWSKIDFIAKYSMLLMTLALLNSANSLCLKPILLNIFGSDEHIDSCQTETHKHHKPTSSMDLLRSKMKKERRIGKKRGFPRIKSEISLSTISEETAEAHGHDYKLDVSINCY